MKHPQLADPKPLIAVKGFEVRPVVFKNSGGEVVDVISEPALPLGLQLSIENQTCVLHGTPLRTADRVRYQIIASNAAGKQSVAIEIAVVEAPIKIQRGEIIHEHDVRHDLDTPRSQIENAMTDQMMMGSTIKPHEKFADQPMGDDRRLTNQTANNLEAEQRAQTAPELTPSPSAQLQAQAVARATPDMSPKLTR